MYLVFRRVYEASVHRPRWAAWYPFANLVVDLILIRAIGMCLTGKVTWRGTEYGVVAAPSGQARRRQVPHQVKPFRLPDSRT